MDADGDRRLSRHDCAESQRLAPFPGPILTCCLLIRSLAEESAEGDLEASCSPRLLDSVFGFFSGRVAGGGQFAGGMAPKVEVVDDVGVVAFGIEAVQAGGLNDRRERGPHPVGPPTSIMQAAPYTLAGQA